MTTEQNLNYSDIPFLKWAGGKRWLTERVGSLMPDTYGRYIEPFLGSGAIFFHLRPHAAVLSDLNPALIETYQAVKENWKDVVRWLEIHSRNHCEKYYYEVRAMKLNKPYTRAAQFIYLNRTCWNGLYRVNLSGQFNVPIGSKQNVFLDTDDFEAVARRLEDVNIRCADFEVVMDDAMEGDIIFADPPYTVHHNLNGFVKYNEKIFRWEDQVRLKDAAVRARNRGVKVIVTNANHPSIQNLYSDGFQLNAVERKSKIAASASARRAFEELLIISE